MYVYFLDASKAFDHVNYWHLCYKLLNHGVPKFILRFLLTWYITQQFAVKWCNIVSMTFSTINVVSQCGILSPRLFNIYIDELRTLLNKSNIACHMNNVSFNHQEYDDESVMLAPSPSVLQKLLYMCEDFARNLI